MTRTRAIRAAASIAATSIAVALLAAGCGTDDPSPTAEPPASPSASASAASPSPSATGVVVKPVRPAAMDDDGPAGAEAAAVYFLELDDYIMKTGDTAEWEAMSYKSCDYCSNRLDQANQIAERGDTFTGGTANARILQTYAQDGTTSIWPLDVELHEEGSLIQDAAGKVVYSSDEAVGKLRVEMARKTGQWTIVGISDIPEK